MLRMMTEEKMQELLFSRAWYDASNYHRRNAKEILANEYPSTDFSSALEEFVLCKSMPPGEWHGIKRGFNNET